MNVWNWAAAAAGIMVVAAGAFADTPASPPIATATCTPAGDGYLRAKIAGAIQAEINWTNRGTTCTGEVRPRGGVRLSFKNEIAPQQTVLFVFGIPGLKEGRNARALPVNLTVVREGAAEFYSTQGDDKCTIDKLTQTAIQGAPHKKRRYRVVARGFCTEPARAVNGEGAVVLSRFDFASELHFADEDESEDEQADQATALARDDESHR